MTKPGPKPAPHNVRQLRGDRPYRYNDTVPVPPETYGGEPPEWLSESAATQHRTMGRRPRALRTGPTRPTPRVLVHLVVAADTWAQGIVNAPAVVRGANGRPVPIPLVATYERAVKYVLSSCTEFGLTPSSRERVRAERLHDLGYDDIAGGPGH